MAQKSRVLISFVLLWFKLVWSLEQQHLTNLRQFRIQGLASRIAVSGSVVEDLLNDITAAGCDLHLSVFGPENNENRELFLGHAVIHDHTLSGLSCNTKETVATSYDVVNAAIPFVTGGQHGIILLAQFTDSEKDIFFPYNTNRDNVFYIDDIEETEDGTITLRHGNDVMIINTQHNETCRKSQRQHVGEDFDDITGKSFTTTDYPLQFDWGCDVFGDEVDLCDILKQNENDLKEAGANVCTEMTTTLQSKRCPASLIIQEMTGFFRDKLPFFSAPTESFEAEWVDREQGVGIVFPCFTG